MVKRLLIETCPHVNERIGKIFVIKAMSKEGFRVFHQAMLCPMLHYTVFHLLAYCLIFSLSLNSVVIAKS